MLKTVSLRRLPALAALAVSSLLPALLPAQGTSMKEAGGRVLLVLPFDNRSGNPSLNWVGDSFPDTLNQRLSTAGFVPITRDDRRFALDHLGFPAGFRPTRATTIRIAQNLDADYVVVGSYNVQGQKIAVQAQVLEVAKLRLSQPIQDSADLPRLFDVENAIAWKISKQIDPQFNVAEQTFLSASAGVQLSAFENYIRGTDAPNPTERVSRLEAAVRDAPGYAAAQLALGKELYTDREYDRAAAMLARVPKTDRSALEANFYLGLARFNSAKYAEAEQAFAFVASRLPLSEVVNDQAVAAARQGHDATALFQRASNADPNDADYRYNLAVAHYRQGDFAGAQREVDQALKLRASDPDATQLRGLIASGRTATAATTGFQPTERLRRTYSEAGFRQAAYQLDQIRAIRLATLPRAQQEAEYLQQGRDYLAQGLLPEAEQEFQSAIQADPGAAAPHAGLAQVRLQSGNLPEAKAEAATSLRISPNVDAYLIQARMALAANDLPGSAANVRSALQLDPNSGAAKGMQAALASRGQTLP